MKRPLEITVWLALLGAVLIAPPRALTLAIADTPAPPRSQGPPNQNRRVFLPPNPRDEAAILAEDAQIPREKTPTGPSAQLSLFGSQVAEGRSFVLLIDRSASMGGGGLNAIHAAAKELAARIDRLTDQQSFQIIAYNESVAYATGRELLPATLENKRRLVKFLDDLPATGQTEHLRGILAALRMKPEVIFLLTDGGDPQLHRGDLQLIRQHAAGRTRIHCIRFGRGPESEPLPFLSRLAADNQGGYTYLDVTAR